MLYKFAVQTVHNVQNVHTVQNVENVHTVKTVQTHCINCTGLYLVKLLEWGGINEVNKQKLF